MASILEINIANAAVAALDEDTAGVIGMLAQNDATAFFAQHVGRMLRRYGKTCVAVDIRMVEVAECIAVADIAARHLPLEKRADLLSFIVERGVNMPLGLQA